MLILIGTTFFVKSRQFQLLPKDPPPLQSVNPVYIRERRVGMEGDALIFMTQFTKNDLHTPLSPALIVSN